MIGCCRWIAGCAVLLAGCAQAPEAYPDLSTQGYERFVEGPDVDLMWFNGKWIAIMERGFSYPPEVHDEHERVMAARLAIILSEIVHHHEAWFMSDASLARYAALTLQCAYNLDAGDGPLLLTDARRFYERWVALESENPQPKALYGAFLCSTRQCEDGLMYFERARIQGSTHALYGMGLALMHRDPNGAREYLQAYRHYEPDDKRVEWLFDVLDRPGEHTLTTETQIGPFPPDYWSKRTSRRTAGQ